MQYPKIDTLFVRATEGPNRGFVNPQEVRRPEFLSVVKWHVTEKIDGTNIRVLFMPAGSQYPGNPRLEFRGKTDEAHLPPFLLDELRKLVTVEQLERVFEPGDYEQDHVVTLYGEGYGERIQRGGGLYRAGVSLRLFDVHVVNIWLDWPNVCDVAEKLHIKTVPSLGNLTLSSQAAMNLFGFPLTFLEHWAPVSKVAEEDGGSKLSGLSRPEGIVVTAAPMLLFRHGATPIRWKLKYRDFPGQSKSRLLH